MSSHDAHAADHHAGDHDHGSLKSYFIGFALSILLTVIPFAIVMAGGLESKHLTIALVLGAAVIQIVVHMIYFLHMKSSTEEGWTLISLIFTLILLVIMLAGSLWVMYHMNANMMPHMGDMGGMGGM
jgi:cytochrome o ubiquinol oxidase operon protein cyoD